MQVSQYDFPHVPLIEAVQLAQAGSSDAFTFLYECYQQGIYGFILGLVSHVETACDLTQEVFLKAWVNLPDLQEAGKFKAWLYAIARNRVHDHWRQQRQRMWESWENISEWHDFESDSCLEEQTAEAELIRLALREVPVKERSCFLLQVVGGFSHQEIAELLGINTTSVHTYLSFARKKLRLAYRRLSQIQGTTE